MKNNLLKELRAVTNTSQRELARIAGTSRTTVYDYETNQRPIPEVTAEKIAKAISSRLTAAYIAGLFDAKGILTIIRVAPNREKFGRKQGKRSNTGPVTTPNYSVRVRLITDSSLLANVLKQFFGAGFVSKRSETQYEFFAASKKAAKVLNVLIPYLVIKRERAQMLLDMQEIMETRPIRMSRDSTTQVFRSVPEASRSLSIPPSDIHTAIRHKHKTNGYTVEKLYSSADRKEVMESLYQLARVR